MAKKIIMFSTKGGVGKSTSVRNLAGELTKNHGKKVLLVDCDENVSLSTSLEKNSNPQTPLTALIVNWALYDEESDATAAICHTAFPGLDIMPSTKKLSCAVNDILPKTDAPDQAFEVLLSDIEDDYDYIFFDMAGSRPTLLCENALRICDYMLVPFDASVDGLNAIPSALKTLEEAKKNNKKLKLLGAFFTAEQNNGNVKDVKASVEENLGEYYIPVSIHRSVDIDYARRDLKPVCYYKQDGKPARDYADLAKYILNKIESEV